MRRATNERPVPPADRVDSGEGAAPERNHAGEETSQVVDCVGCEAAPLEDVKVVVSIKERMVTIGVQRPMSDPRIESFDGHDLPGLAQRVLGVVERARARWEGSLEAHSQRASRCRAERGDCTWQEAYAGTATTQVRQRMLRPF